MNTENTEWDARRLRKVTESERDRALGYAARHVEPEYCEGSELIAFEAFGLGDLFDVSIPEQ
ncbi:MAG TPA: hypothetical protein PK869_16115 [Candidatus Hydrogenedentes bacterium]|nr:hypothetical protein [Candidatus Hydrogenedentota bacterium]